MKRILKVVLGMLCGLLAILLALLIALWLYTNGANMRRPQIAEEERPQWVLQRSDTLRVMGPNWLKQAAWGLWLMHVEGAPYARGYAAGQMGGDLVHYQEEAFLQQIYRFIPSRWYRKLLFRLVVLFDYHLAEYVNLEYRKEIFGVAEVFGEEQNELGPPYERQLNYHAAHDIGHAAQSYRLVGCTAFALRDSASRGMGLLVGRNFDMDLGDDFARHKMVMDCQPTQGYRFVSVAWPAMMGVVSGINEKGVTVTINALPQELPKSAKTPISLIAREIVQYAQNIEEAYTIARRRPCFVSECLLVASASEQRAALIEKTPDTTLLFEPEGSELLVTNQFTNPLLVGSVTERASVAYDSQQRMARLRELLDSLRSLDAAGAARVLRDDKGAKGMPLPRGAAGVINQYQSHHSVIFAPQEGMMWVAVDRAKSTYFALRLPWADSLGLRRCPEFDISLR